MTTATEDLADALRRHAVDVDRLAGSVRNDCMTELDALEDDVAGALAANDLTGENNPRRRAALLALLLALLNDTVNGRFATLDAGLRDELYGVAEHAGDQAAQLLADAVGEPVHPPTEVDLNTAADPEVEGATVSRWLAQLAADLAFRLARGIRTALAAGGRLPELLAVVRGGDSVTSVMAATRRSVDVVVRTAVHAAGNLARMGVFQHAGQGDIAAFQHISTIDNRTSVTCLARAGLTWAVNLEPIGHDLPFQVPPLHPACRSVVVPILAGDDPVVDETFDTWMERQPASYQREVLGAGRYRLWRAGRLRQNELTDNSGRPLTLAELRART
jgi:hypothetical protein